MKSSKHKGRGERERRIRNGTNELSQSFYISPPYLIKIDTVDCGGATAGNFPLQVNKRRNNYNKPDFAVQYNALELKTTIFLQFHVYCCFLLFNSTFSLHHPKRSFIIV